MLRAGINLKDLGKIELLSLKIRANSTIAQSQLSCQLLVSLNYKYRYDAFHIVYSVIVVGYVDGVPTGLSALVMD
jgi:hypothetical protein